MSYLDEDEFYDVYRQFKPEATREQFAEAWKRFQKERDEWLRERTIQ